MEEYKLEIEEAFKERNLSKLLKAICGLKKSEQPDTTPELVFMLRNQIVALVSRNKELEEALDKIKNQNKGEYKTYTEWKNEGMTVLQGEHGIKLDDGKFYFERKQVVNITELSQYVREQREREEISREEKL